MPETATDLLPKSWLIPFLKHSQKFYASKIQSIFTDFFTRETEHTPTHWFTLRQSILPPACSLFQCLQQPQADQTAASGQELNQLSY